MINVTRAIGMEDILQMKALQWANLKQNITDEEARTQGFLTATYSEEYFKEMHDAEPAIVAKDGDKVVGYALVATQEVRKGHDLVEGLFNSIDECMYDGVLLSAQKYVVVGQLCVAKEYRGMKLVDRMYQHFAESMYPVYQYVVTDVDVDNTRSLRAHERSGFEVIGTLEYGGKKWNIVLKRTGVGL
jgi:ribosomal protein S18 acetylase RimI-like enzyme